MQTEKVQPKAEAKQTNTESGSLETENVSKTNKHRIGGLETENVNKTNTESGGLEPENINKTNKHRIRWSENRKRKQNKQTQNKLVRRPKTLTKQSESGG